MRASTTNKQLLANLLNIDFSLSGLFGSQLQIRDEPHSNNKINKYAFSAYK